MSDQARPTPPTEREEREEVEWRMRFYSGSLALDCVRNNPGAVLMAGDDDWIVTRLRTNSPEEPTCDDCGTELWYNTWVEDDVWEAIRPEPGPEGGGGVLCARCIDRRCAEAGLEDVAVRMHWTGEAAKCHSPEEPPNIPKCPWCGETLPVGRHVGDCSEKPSPEEPVGWRPMETAPKDGTAVQGFDPDLYQGRGGQHVLVWMDFKDKPGWYSPGGNLIAYDPSHWAPLPEPPIGQALATQADAGTEGT